MQTSSAPEGSAATVASLWRYPVKGLSPQALSHTTLAMGDSIAGDRRYAIAHSNTLFESATPAWLPKKNFLMLAKNSSLAALSTRWIESTHTLIIEQNGHQVARGDLSTPPGQVTIAEFIGAYLKGDGRGTPRLVETSGTFSDNKNKVLSLFSQASLHDLERVAGQRLDERRFRGNVMIDGVAPWSEFTWVGRDIVLGGARLHVTERISRCPATSANPDTGAVDINVPRCLMKGFGHICFGVYANVIDGGPVSVGDVLSLAP